LYVRQLFLEEKTLPRIDLVNLVSHTLGVSKERLLMEPQRQLTEAERSRVQELIEERQKGKPLAYLTHQREFFSNTFYIDDRVLIPRPETELLVEEALSLMETMENPARVLDMGTGSGIIGIMLAKGGAEDVLCVDLSPGAIAVAQKNSRILGVEEQLTFLVSDLFSAMKTGGHSFDLICANLPYVSSDQYEKLADEVRCFEPRAALFGGADGMEPYGKFVRDLGGYLRPGGFLLCEIDGAEQSRMLGDLLERAGLDVTIRKDLTDRQRVVKGAWTSSS
jgi:release factor glutamine methyltransferase